MIADYRWSYRVFEEDTAISVQGTEFIQEYQSTRPRDGSRVCVIAKVYS